MQNLNDVDKNDLKKKYNKFIFVKKKNNNNLKGYYDETTFDSNYEIIFDQNLDNLDKLYNIYLVKKITTIPEFTKLSDYYDNNYEANKIIKIVSDNEDDNYKFKIFNKYIYALYDYINVYSNNSEMWINSKIIAIDPTLKVVNIEYKNKLNKNMSKKIKLEYEKMQKNPEYEYNLEKEKNGNLKYNLKSPYIELNIKKKNNDDFTFKVNDMFFYYLKTKKKWILANIVDIIKNKKIYLRYYEDNEYEYIEIKFNLENINIKWKPITKFEFKDWFDINNLIKYKKNNIIAWAIIKNKSNNYGLCILVYESDNLIKPIIYILDNYLENTTIYKCYLTKEKNKNFFTVANEFTCKGKKKIIASETTLDNIITKYKITDYPKIFETINQEKLLQNIKYNTKIKKVTEDTDWHLHNNHFNFINYRINSEIFTIDLIDKHVSNFCFPFVKDNDKNKNINKWHEFLKNNSKDFSLEINEKFIKDINEKKFEYTKYIPK